MAIFVMKILKSADDESRKWKLISECKIFIALVRGLLASFGFYYRATGLSPDRSSVTLRE